MTRFFLGKTFKRGYMFKASFPFLAFLFVLADQLSKWAVTEMMIRPALGPDAGAPLAFFAWLTGAPPRLPFAAVEVLPFFNIVMVWNKGVSFGLFNQGSDYGPLLLSFLSLVIAGIFLVWLFRTTSKLQGLAIAMVIGGAIGNVIDRARFGAVVDFLDVHISGYHWPAFNIADSCICVGVFLLIIYAFFFETREKDAR